MLENTSFYACVISPDMDRNWPGAVWMGISQRQISLFEAISSFKSPFLKEEKVACKTRVFASREALALWPRMELRHTPPPHKKGISAMRARYRRYPMKTMQIACDTPSAILSRKGIARYGGASRMGCIGPLPIKKDLLTWMWSCFHSWLLPPFLRCVCSLALPKTSAVCAPFLHGW